MSGTADDSGLSGRTTDAGEVNKPLRDFLRTETGSAAVLLAAVVAALVWANIDLHAYEMVWATDLSVRIGSYGLSLDLHEWINSGLMTFFFLVVGLEARREFDVGELRDRRWVLLSLLAGVSSMIVPVLIYLAINSGRDSVHGWGAAMSTDTAFALGILAILGSRLPASLRAFILSVAVVDDLIALLVIAVVYSEAVHLPALAVAVGAMALILVVRFAGVGRGPLYALLAVVVWVALQKAGIDPVVTGLAVGALAVAYPAARSDLEAASGLFRRFREQPTPELERSVRRGLASAVSTNERLVQMYHPWTSYVIVPLFALANAGIPVGADELARAFTSPVTLGILAAYVVGKLVGVLGSTALVTRLTRRRLRPPVGWGSVAAAGSISGAGFTVSLLIAALAFEGEELDNAKIGILATLIGAFVVSWSITVVIGLLPARRRARALLGTTEPLTDLAVPVDEERDRMRGPRDAPVTVVEYGDFECPYCGQAEPVVREMLADEGDVRYVFRHLPLTDVHPNAQLAAEAAEAAGEQGAFWEMHDLLMERQDALRPTDLVRYASELGLDVDAFRHHIKRRRGAGRIADDVESADLSGVTGTPTFFVNGRRHQGAYDITGLTEAVELARQRSLLSPPT
ncbi:Na+/H+ antiporter NhaA [Streptomyces sp. MS2.AVA.5]|uniref:Na+/H+ antiporter NhaA n=1 Tax=Streptomyces achmelvichensis TaxID=3134111 RepID=A0ACC6Q838_9ACTN